jgi:hypothetical protein
MIRHLAVLPLVCASLISPGMARADATRALCGMAFHSRSDLRAKLRTEHARFFVGEGVTSALTSSASASTLWWLTEPKSPAFPAVACVQKHAAPGRGFELRPAEACCGRASTPECIRLKRGIRRAKF